MELTGAISEGEWSSLSGLYTAEEAAFMAQLLTNTSSAPNHLNFGGSSSNFAFSSSAYWSGPENAVTDTAGASSSSNLYRFSQESCDFNGESFHLSDSPHPFLMSNNDGCVSTNFCLGNLENGDCFQLEDDESNVQINIEAGLQKPELAIDDEGKKPESSKKRSRSFGEKSRNVRSKKSQEDGNCEHSRQSTSSYYSEDESNASQEPNGGAISAEARPARTRASRGSATDPQSLYARRRRERINERLRILQNLVPNGTKVDISTMLEEAVQYVKFLQLQIKLLSSDELWMYAPIAYNGMDIGLNLNLDKPKDS